MNLLVALIKIGFILGILLIITRLPDLIEKIATKILFGEQGQQATVEEPWQIEALESSPLYRQVLAYAMVSSVKEYHEPCGLKKPGDLTGHLAPYGEGVRLDPQLGIVFEYRFSRAKELNKEGKYANTTVPVNDMARQLNQVIGNYTLEMNWHPLRIVAQRSMDLGQVYFCLAPFTDENGVDWKAVNTYLEPIKGGGDYYG